MSPVSRVVPLTTIRCVTPSLLRQATIWSLSPDPGLGDKGSPAPLPHDADNALPRGRGRRCRRSARGAAHIRCRCFRTLTTRWRGPQQHSQPKAGIALVPPSVERSRLRGRFRTIQNARDSRPIQRLEDFVPGFRLAYPSFDSRPRLDGGTTPVCGNVVRRGEDTHAPKRPAVHTARFESSPSPCRSPRRPARA